MAAPTAKPQPSPTAPVAGAGAPLPSSRPAPTSAVYTVPLSIPHDCSRAADSAIAVWIASVPDNSTLRFASNGCYGQDGTILVPDRHGLVIDGNGSTFKALTVGVYNRSNWRILAGSNITLENMTVRGANPHAGTGPAAYDTRFEWQHGYEFQATQGGTLYNVQAYDVYGDFVEAQEDGRLGGYVSPPARNIVVASSHFERSGRMGVGLTDIDGFVLRNSYMSDVRWDAVDVEPGAAQMAGRNVQVLNNTFRAINFAVLSNFGAGGSNVANITVTGNTQMGAPLTCDPPVWVSSPPGLYRSGYTVSNNTFVSYGSGVDVTRVNNLNVSGNVISFSPGQCSSWAGVNLVDAHSVTVSNNTFRQASTLIQEDAASSSVTSYNNTTG